jgi:predicted CXXCH cytochrome family protein
MLDYRKTNRSTSTSGPRRWQAAALIIVCLGLAAATIHAADQSQPAAVVDPASAGYVNPRLCFGCHAAIYKTYLQTGMGKSFGRPRPENTVEDYTKNNRFFHAASGTYFEMSERGGEYYQRRYQLGYGGKPTNVDETKIDYVLGSALHARAYLHRTQSGGIVQLPVVWYSENGGHWGMAPGYDSPTQIFGLRPVTYDCIFCHNAYESIPGSHGRLGDEPVHSASMPEGIDCQRCHGPGQKHVQLAGTPGATAPDIRKSIVNPSRLNPDRQAEVCYQCHLQTTGFSLPHAVKRYDRGDFSYRPGEPLADYQLAFNWRPEPERSDWFQNVSTAVRMRMSQCFIQSKGALQCTTCHDPHSIQHGNEAADRYNAVCRQCHTAAFNSLVAAKKHTAETGCIGCHMPQRRPVEVVHIIKTDHFIQRNKIQRTKPAIDLQANLAEGHETEASG